jgi:hypothetical protein
MGRIGRYGSRCRATECYSSGVLASANSCSSASAAHADDRDDSFLDAVKRHHIVPAGDPAVLMDWTHWACDQLGQGSKKGHIVVWMAQCYPGLRPDVGLNAEFLRVAALYHCPELKYEAGW